MNFWQNFKKPIIAVAPMDGVTDCAFRSILKQGGADVVYSEFVSTDGIYHNLKNMEGQMAYTEEQRPYICQIFGKDPKLFHHAAGVVADMGADGVDINFGCPSKRVVKHGSGVKLMTNLPLVREIVQATIEGSKGIPVSIKIRAGINMKIADQDAIDARFRDVEKMTAIQMLDFIKDLDFKAVMIHGRTYEQGFIGELDYKQVDGVKELVGDRPVLINGGITTPEIAKEVLEKCNADGVGIGRGVFGRPWLLQQIKDYLEKGSYDEKSWNEIKLVILEHAKKIFEQKGNHGLLELRKHLGWYIKGFPNASEARASLMRVESLEEVKKIISSIG